METVKVQQTIAEHEDPNEVGNDSAVRRATLQETGGLKGNTHMSRCKAKFHRKSITRKTAIQAPTVPLPDHLKGLYEDSIKGKSKLQQVQVHSLLQKHEEVFSKDEYDLGHTHLVEHTIDTGDAKPIKQLPRWIPIALTGEEHEALGKLQAQGVICPSTSPWSSPIVLVWKKSGQVWPCIDYQQLNKVTKDVAYPIPRTQDCLDAMIGATMFLTMDITLAYNQVLVAEKDIPKTAFVTKYGLYEFTKMPFGLSIAPQTYECLMELTLSGLQWSLCLIYLDDVIVFFHDFDEHIDRLDKVLSWIGAAGLKLKPNKCIFFAPKVSFLGHIVSQDGVSPDPDNIAKIANWPTPKNIWEVHGILGMGNYYCRFVKDFSQRVQPLVALTKKNNQFNWSLECQAVFDDIKQALTGLDIMAFPTDHDLYILDCDAADDSIVCVLGQKQSNEEKVIAYGSWTLGKSERNYCATNWELLAVKYFMEYYKHYLLGRHFRVTSDHEALKWLFSMKEPKHQIFIRIWFWVRVLSWEKA